MSGRGFFSKGALREFGVRHDGQRGLELSIAMDGRFQRSSATPRPSALFPVTLAHHPSALSELWRVGWGVGRTGLTFLSVCVEVRGSGPLRRLLTIEKEVICLTNQYKCPYSSPLPTFKGINSRLFGGGF